MRKLPERFIINVALSASFIILTLFAVYGFYLLKDLLNSNAMVNHTRVVIEEVKDLSLSLSDISRGVGNYLLSGNEDYVNDLNEPIIQTSTSIKNLEVLTSDNPRQKARLTILISLIEKRSSMQQQIIEAYKNTNVEKAHSLKNSATLMNINKKINTIITAMNSEELNLLKQRTTQLEYYMRKSEVQLFLTFILGEVFLLSSILLLNVHLSKKKRLEKKLRLAEKNLLANKERYDFALRGSNTGLWHWDLESNTVFYSDECKRVLGYTNEDLKNTKILFQDILHPDDKPNADKILQENLNKQDSFSVDFRLKLSTGDYSWFQCQGQAICEKGRAVRIAGSLVDISERKKLDKIKNEFISVVSHELRTPLTSIRGSLGLILSGKVDHDDDKLKRLLDIANGNCERLLTLINDILDVEKIEAGKMDFSEEIIEVSHLLNNAVSINKPFADKFAVNLVFLRNVENFHVKADPNRLMQVMTNLISNAVKYSFANETVFISVEKKHDRIRIAIINRGPGIPKEFHARIFEKFAQADSTDTRAKGGTGLGLNISKKIIERFGGMISFSSEVNKLTTFYIDLPSYNKLKSKEEELKIT